ncbi:Exonuclease mut-7 [Podochytrium sp. JEL0797]|nr:Exonuclease mut-7 [Podochytrium sp. JEL0797]
MGDSDFDSRVTQLLEAALAGEVSDLSQLPPAVWLQRAARASAAQGDSQFSVGLLGACVLPGALGAVQHVAAHRKTFKLLASIVAEALSNSYSNYNTNDTNNKRKREQTKQTPPEDLVLVPIDILTALAALLVRDDTSPLAVHLLSAFPAAFLATNLQLHDHLLTKTMRNAFTATEAFMLIQPPFFTIDPSKDLSPNIIKAIIFLMESGETRIATVLKPNPTLLIAILTTLNETWNATLCEIESAFDKHPGSIGFSRKSTAASTSETNDAENDTTILDQQRALSKSMFVSKSVLKVASVCGLLIASSDSHYTAITTVAKFTTLKWMLFEVVRYFETIRNMPGVEVDEDAFLEGPLPLLENVFQEMCEEYRPLAVKLAVEEVASRMAGFEAGILGRVLELMLEPFGYTRAAPLEKWKWVESTVDKCVSDFNARRDVDNGMKVVSEVEEGDGDAAAPADVPEVETTYYTSAITPVFVGDKESFALFQQAVLPENCTCVALDCEWRPDSFKLVGETDGPAATLQVAVCKLSEDGQMERVHCFVLGLLNSEIEEEEFVAVVGSLFADENILKLGFQFSEDTSRLRIRYPSLPGEITNLYDMARVTTNQKTKDTFAGKKRISLNDLVKQYLHVNMEKRIRLSNWEMRPLTSRQLMYAANDTLALLDAYIEMRKAGDLETSPPVAGAGKKDKKPKHKKSRKNEQ